MVCFIVVLFFNSLGWVVEIIIDFLLLFKLFPVAYVPLLFESVFDCGFMYSSLLCFVRKLDMLLFLLFRSEPFFIIMFVFSRWVLSLDELVICLDLWMGVAILLS